MNLTFQEKSLWIQAIALTLLFGGYFLRVLPTDATSISNDMIVDLVGVVIGLTIIMIIGHIIAAATNTPEELDERDRQIQLKASHLKSTLLASGCVLTILLSLKVPGNFWSVHTLLIFLVVAELTEISLQLFYYRRGI